MDTFRDIIDAWPSAAEFARDVGTSGVNARGMRRDNRLPANFWVEAIQKAEERGIEGVTLERLADIAANRTAAK